MQHFKQRVDAVWLNKPRRQYVPTVYGEKTGNTVFVSDWASFRAAGGAVHFNEDQTEIVLTLPAGHKFGIRFQDAGECESDTAWGPGP